MKKQKKKRINFAAAHKRLWLGWMAEFPEREKIDWPEFKSNGGTIPDVWVQCFACEAEELIYFCPLLNKDCTSRTAKGCLDGLYLKWGCAVTKKAKRKYALMIGNLKWHGKKMFEIE